MDLTNKDQLIQYLKQHGLWAKKSMGQNFLVDRVALDKIVAAAELKSTDTVLEIGPGAGTLTEELVQRVGKVVAIEKDDNLALLLNDKFLISNFKLNPNLQILNEDALDFDPVLLCHPERSEGSSKYNIEDSSPVAQNDNISGTKKLKKLKKLIEANEANDFKLVANIPYYITSKILEKFLSGEHKPELIVLLVQKEVAERICAKTGNLSVLAISVQYFGEPEIVDIVRRDSFFPAPEVDSAILRIKIRKATSTDLVHRKDTEAEFFKTVRVGFRARRKTLFNNLKAGTNLNNSQILKILDKIGLDRNIRAQELGVEEWEELTLGIRNNE